MGRRTIVICTDDLTGEEVPETQISDLPLRFGYDEWTLTLTGESATKVRELFADLVKTAPHKDHTPKWLRDQQEAAGRQANQDEGSGTDEPQPKVTIVPPDKATVRRWWRDLTAPNLRTLNLPAPPPTDRGKIPEAVVEAFVVGHAAPTPQFSG